MLNVKMHMHRQEPLSEVRALYTMIIGNLLFSIMPQGNRGE